MRILRLYVMLVLLLGVSRAQSPTPTPADRPKLNRPSMPEQSQPAPASPTPAASPSSTQSPSSPPPGASPSPTPEAGSGQPGAPVAYPKPEYADLQQRFSYDSRNGLELRETNVEKRGPVRLIELNYAGDGGDRVPAWLLIPPGNGPFPAVIWGHWLMKGSPLNNKDEFLEEALVLARAGVVSMLIDAPQARHGYVEAQDLMEYVKQQSEAAAHQVIDLRRAIDRVLLRHDVDRRRIAYVGHSWSAHVGAILAGVDTRVCCYVLMASGYSDEEETFTSQDPAIVRYRQQLGDDTLREYFHDYAYDDPVYYIGHTNNESIFLQFASGDQTTKAMGQKYLDLFSAKDKQMQFYEAGHALNAAARLDRVRWLQKKLGVKKVDEREVGAVPQLK
jgi:pimeloyl-ACP methyl ester carboxylesterase